ncbi:hypothetical protein WISP_92291 [Willisornis vidua]|uniref:Uncharacterized protein n=1 Tax=Willisornis vidua TaxID=1566151 RepID=A0ABQ9D1E5_9PASS|nr:hypothetical protein WISP_92291 [Willisornis vidua]
MDLKRAPVEIRNGLLYDARNIKPGEGLKRTIYTGGPHQLHVVSWQDIYNFQAVAQTGQFLMISKIFGQLEFTVQAHYVISTIHLLNVVHEEHIDTVNDCSTSLPWTPVHTEIPACPAQWHQWWFDFAQAMIVHCGPHLDLQGTAHCLNLYKKMEGTETGLSRDKPKRVEPELRGKSMAQLKCMYTNAHSIRNRQEELEAIIQQENYDIVAVTET